MMHFLRYYLPFFMLVYFLVIFALPSYRVFKQTGINPITFGKTDNAHDYIGSIMKLLIALLFVSVLFFSIGNELYHYLEPINYLQINWLHYVGLFFIHAALIWIFVAQSHMKQSWRIGIDVKNETSLITNGLFKLSRNPIFLGMIISTWGFFLVLPNALTFFLAATTYLIIHIQIRLEEEYLAKRHREVYQDYKQKVNRLI